MKHNRIFKRLTAIMLSVVFLCASIAPVFAWIPAAGMRCGSKIGPQYLSSDGRNYMDVQEDYYALHYHPDGSTTMDFVEGRYKVRRHLLLVDPDTKEEKWVYCIEAATDFDISSNGYLSDNMDNSEYFLMLPYTARIGIMCTLLYGHQEGKAIPIAGLNADDAFYAGQVLIWEFQQGLRTDAGARKDNGKIKADIYFNLIKDRPAEKMYNYLLGKIKLHSTIPSFASRNKENAPTHTMKYDSSTGKYSITLTDTNNCGEDLQQLTTYGLNVIRSGNQYTISTDKPIMTAVSAEYRKNIPFSMEKLLIWGRPNYQTVCTGAQDPITFYMNIRTEAFGSLKLKKVSEDGKISGIPFRITGNGVDKTVTTNSDGEILFSELRAGTYTVTEQTGEVYVPQKSQQVTIVPGQTATVTFSNTLKRGSLRVTKSSEDGFTEGIRFHLYGKSQSGILVDEYAVTDLDGIAVFPNVLISDSLTLEEVDTDNRYVVPPKQNVVIMWNEVTNKAVSNILKKWRATVTKADSEAISPQGDASLSGAKYGVYKGNQLIDTYTTEEHGQFITKWYACGENWTLRELQPSEGYLLDKSVYPVGADPGEFTIERNEIGIDLNEQVIQGKISILKHTDNGDTQIETPEVGAEFEIYLKSSGSYSNAKETERDILSCDKNGYAQTKALPYGWYTVHQTKGWDGREFIEDFDVFISQNEETYRFLINNANFESYLKIVKKDAESGKVIPLAGAGFQILNPDGEIVIMSYTYPTPDAISTFYTSSDGTLMTPEPLPYGKGYSIVEVQAPPPYILDSAPVYFDITPETAGKENGITVVMTEKFDLPQKGKITVKKSGEVFSSVTEQDSVYQPVYIEQGLSGAQFAVVAAEDIVSGGIVCCKKGEKVATIITDSDGTAQTPPLYLGVYEVYEETAPPGMVLSPERHTVVLSYAGQFVEITETEMKFTNERQKCRIELQKKLEQDEVFQIGMNDEMKIVQFGLYAAEDIIAADGKAIPKDGLIELVSVSASGTAVFQTDLPVGSKLHVKEYSTDEHYRISEEKYPVSFDYAGQDVPTVTIWINDGKPIENKLIRGNISGKKLDDDGNVLQGAVFGLFSKNEISFTKENAILTAVSDENGLFTFSNLPYGEYLMKELSCPTGFVLSDKMIPITISEQGQMIELELTNQKIPPAPDNPKTGSRMLGLWIAISIFSGSMMIASALILWKIQKENKKK